MLPSEICEKYYSNLNPAPDQSLNFTYTKYSKMNLNNFSKTNNSFNYYVQKKARKEYMYTKDNIKRIIYNSLNSQCDKEKFRKSKIFPSISNEAARRSKKLRKLECSL